MDRIKSDPKYKVLVGLVQGRPYVYSINMQKPPTNQLAVRQAMEYAINQEAIVKPVFGPYQSLGATRRHARARAHYLGLRQEGRPGLTWDPEKAKQLLYGAGWKSAPTASGQGWPSASGGPGTWENGVAEVIQAQFRDVGIDYKIQVAPVVATNEAARREQVHMSPIC